MTWEKWEVSRYITKSGVNSLPPQATATMEPATENHACGLKAFSVAVAWCGWWVSGDKSGSGAGASIDGFECAETVTVASLKS